MAMSIVLHAAKTQRQAAKKPAKQSADAERATSGTPAAATSTRFFDKAIARHERPLPFHLAEGVANGAVEARASRNVHGSPSALLVDEPRAIARARDRVVYVSWDGGRLADRLLNPGGIEPLQDTALGKPERYREDAVSFPDR